MAAKRTIIKVEPLDLTPEEVAQWDAEIEQAEREFADPAARPARVTLHWTQGSLDFVKRAANLHGIPYDAYLKEAAVRQALADLSMADKVAS